MATSRASAPKTAFKPTLVHAYRRQPHMVDNGRGELVEKEVEVVFSGEKVKFKSNAAGHIVGLVEHEHVFKRLVEEISEAYIPYAGGDNVPEKQPEAGPVKPDGAFVLESADGEFKVLDNLSDEDLRAFAAEVQIEADALPEALTGDTLRRAIYNLLGGQ